MKATLTWLLQISFCEHFLCIWQPWELIKKRVLKKLHKPSFRVKWLILFSLLLYQTGWTPLLICCVLGYEAVAALLLSNGCNINFQSAEVGVSCFRFFFFSCRELIFCGLPTFFFFFLPYPNLSAGIFLSLSQNTREKRNLNVEFYCFWKALLCKACSYHMLDLQPKDIFLILRLILVHFFFHLSTLSRTGKPLFI